MATIPTSTPTLIPTSKPSVRPSSYPSQFPSKVPSSLPSFTPTPTPLEPFSTMTLVIAGLALAFIISLIICIPRLRAFGNSAYFRHKNSGRVADEETLLDNHNHLMEMAKKVYKQDMIREAKLSQKQAKKEAKSGR